PAAQRRGRGGQAVGPQALRQPAEFGRLVEGQGGLEAAVPLVGRGDGFGHGQQVAGGVPVLLHPVPLVQGGEQGLAQGGAADARGRRGGRQVPHRDAVAAERVGEAARGRRGGEPAVPHLLGVLPPDLL